MEDQRILTVRKRLITTGELTIENMGSAVFDELLVEAVKRFQNRHNLATDGVIGNKTLAAMNVPVSSRIDQIIINMERYRWLKRLSDDSLVVVNIAGFEVAAGQPQVNLM